MELKYVVMTIVKILISVPPAILITSQDTNGAALMGGHIDNKNSSISPVTVEKPAFDYYDMYEEKDGTPPNPTVSTVK